MNKFVRNLLTEWRKLELPFEDKAIIIAVSGGADSVSLLLALQNLFVRKKLNLKFIAAHFNHNLRGAESDKDAEFVKELAEKLEIEFVQEKQDPDSQILNQKGNLEENARIARYKFLKRIAEEKNAYAVLTAHTLNDQAETLLFNLIRGSGLEGLSGIKVRRNIEKQSEIQVIRPLLNWAKRKDTEEFCFENQIKFRQDAMNDDLKFTRVRIRKEIIPLLEKLNPRVVETISNTANLLQNDVRELSDQSEKLSDNFLQKELMEMPKPMRLRALRDWVQRMRGNLRQIEMKHLEAIERLICSRKSGTTVELPNGEKVIKRNGKVLFEKSRVEKR